VQFWTAEPFVVGSQDAAHPFYLAGHMTGGAFLATQRSAAELTAGDPEFVNVVPLEQFMNQYTFFTDPTYSETNLVVVRRPGSDGRLADVTLGCSGKPLAGWMPLGDVQYTRVDLSTGDYKPVIPGCYNGVHTMTSTAPFSVTVWGWGTKASGGLGVGTVSYAYPAGAALGTVTTAPPPVIP
jgi:IgGFc binding protein